MPSDANTTIAVHCQGLTKTYGDGPAEVIALRGIDLDIYKGELLMIVGPSGCGKTTLISVIAAILDQDEGKCEVFGKDLKHMDEAEKVYFRGQYIGFVFQVFNLLPALTAAENVAIPLLLYGMNRKLAIDKARTVLESVGLETRTEALPAQLSGGQQQRVAIARSIIHDPRLIICDEPTSNLDHKTGHDMINILRDVARRSDRALIIVTHDTRILGFADRIARMDDGRIIEITEGQQKVAMQ